MSWITGHAASWEAQYQGGRYLGDPPEPFVSDIVHASRSLGIGNALYIGCGNGRNLVPLLDAGLPIRGVDISRTAVDQFRSNRPEYSDRVFVGDVSSLPLGETFDLVVGIQVFMFGTTQQATDHLRDAQSRVNIGGVLALRANAEGTDVWPAHEVVETNRDGSFTVTYMAGPKQGLQVHFFSADELAAIFTGWRPVLPLRRDLRARANGNGQWTQFEGIWQRTE